MESANGLLASYFLYSVEVTGVLFWPSRILVPDTDDGKVPTIQSISYEIAAKK